MVIVRRVTVDDFEKIYPLILAMNNPRITKENWRELFVTNWSDEGYCGFGLFDEKEALGFLGLLFSRRNIRGKLFKYANITTWIVDERIRGKGHTSKLLNEVLSLKDYSVTSLTHNEKAKGILTGIGFKETISKFLYIPPFPSLSLFSNRISFDKEYILTKVSDSDKKIINDHSFMKCIHILIENKEGYSYILGARKNRIPAIQLHYISNKKVFLDGVQSLNFVLLFKRRLIGIFLNELILGQDKYFFSFPFLNLKQNSIMKSEELSMLDFPDNLYTEYPILGI